MKIYLVGGAVRDALMGMRPDVTLEEDLARRDITINAIAAPAYPMGLTARFAM
ncbi:MAG: hypothetical protein IPH35_02665 [Rhodoferax sp.]|nr:hypothetical protein [Rhodoferax sp.]